MSRKFTRMHLLAPLATAATIGVGLLASPGSPAIAAVGGVSHVPTAKVVKISAQLRKLASTSAAKGNLIKPSVTAAIMTYHVTSAGALAGIHACRSLGTDGTTQGVECADLFAEPDGAGGVLVFPQAEGICERGTTEVQCANNDILLNVNLGSGSGSPIDEGLCGHSNGNCLSSRNFFVGSDGFDLTGCGGVGTSSEVWTVVWTGSDIELPGSAKNVASTSNLGSGHAIVCP